MTPVTELRISLMNILIRQGITTAEILSLCSETELQLMHMVSSTSIEDLKLELAACKMSFRSHDKPMLAKALDTYGLSSNMPLYILTASSDIGENTKRMLHNRLGPINLGELCVVGKAELTSTLVTWKHLDARCYTIQHHLDVIKSYLAGFSLTLNK